MKIPNMSFAVVMNGPVAIAGSIPCLSSIIGIKVPTNAAIIITVCDNAKETCPIFIDNNAKKIHKDFKDPSKLNNGLYGVEFTEVRDQIKSFIIDFIKRELF